MKNLSEKFTTFIQDFKNVHQEAKKTRLCQYYETPVEGPFCRTHSLSMDLSPAYFQRSLLLRMDQSPQEGGGLDGKSLNSSRNDGERVF